MYNSNKYQIIFFLIFLISSNIYASSDVQKIQGFSNATIYTPKQHKTELKKVIEVLQEEVQKRSGVLWPVSKKLNKKDRPQIIIAFEDDRNNLPEAWKNEIDQLDEIGSEGYRIIVLSDVNKVIIIANDKRGALYGVGKLLRKMTMRSGEVLIPNEMKISSTPRYQIRGHQLGYRPKTNSYDAWSIAQFDQYIRELAIFGANSIEIMPPETDDDLPNSLMQIPATEMIIAQSSICDAYDLDVWMWYPNIGSDFTHPDFIQKELKERHEVFSKLKRLDHVFVPGGDPGHLEPDVLFSWLIKMSSVLHQSHPNAKIWVSPQLSRPSKEWVDKFFTHINKKYEWLGGVVFGPWVKTPLEEIRKIVDADIPIRRYPDITHTISSQYPIPKWDLAFTNTLGRECINPRPNDEKMIHNALDQFANGSLSYSEGTNDDVNKFIWSDQDWDPGIPVIETLRDYARFFIGPDYEEDIAQGFLSQEQHFDGPLITNEHVQNTLMQWQNIEERSSSAVRANFRFQMGLIRAYFDAYVQKRLIYETYLEQQAKEDLSNYTETGVGVAIENCKSTLAKAWLEPIYPEYKIKCEKLADDLFNSIGAQLTIEKHGASPGRGNFIDNINHPLNDAAWILSELGRVENSDYAGHKIEIINGILHRTNPGPGGFYDNFGNIASWKKVIIQHDISTDPGTLLTPRVGFGVGAKDVVWVHKITSKNFKGQAAPMSWMNQITTLYDQPLKIEYKNLNPSESYKIRIAYTGRFRTHLKMMADDIQVHDYIKTGVQPLYEFPIPQEALRDGKVIFTWTCGKAERGSQVSEIWIIKKPN